MSTIPLPMTSLEEQLEKAYSELGISEKNQGSVNTYLNLLKIKDQNTYEHSIRVGLRGIKVAEHSSLDQKALFYAGTLHDIGKILISPEVLKKTGKFNKKDMAEMKKHAKYSYKLLTGVHEFSAQIALRHHKYQQEKYPKKLKKSETKLSKDTKSDIDFYARILSVIDFYDAITTRDDHKFGKNKLNTEEIKKLLIKNHPGQELLINELYTDKIFRAEN
ncbi:MAG: HD domain-containing protein [Nanoarchaeota archaeon]|nr:HD domain-containing protein [Nanoarchaeota archaeon]